MGEKYNLKQQRNTFILTLRNDIVLKEYPKDVHKKYFDQYASGKAFKGLWNYTLFRLLVDMALPFMMLVSDILLPAKYTVTLLFHKKQHLTFKRLFLTELRRLETLSKNARIQKEDDVWCYLPWDKYKLSEEHRIITVFDYISFGDVWKSAVQALLIHTKTVISLGYDKYLLSYKAYEWCIVDDALRRVPSEVELIFGTVCDRMAILIDRLPNINKTMMQHGTMHFHNVDPESPFFTWHEDLEAYTWNSIYESSPSTVYCYTKDDAVALSRSVIANHPKYIYMGYGFKTSFKTEKKSVLIIGHPNYFLEKEGEIIKNLQGLKIEVFLKNHPTESNSYYDGLRGEYVFTFIEGMDTRLPDVDIVISYDSTLAYEYASIGAKVLYYGHFDVANIRQIVTDYLGLVGNEQENN